MKKSGFRARGPKIDFKVGQNSEDVSIVYPPKRKAYPHRIKKSATPKSLPTKKKRKSKSLASLKHSLDSIFSKYIRAKFPASCYTCGVIKERKDLQCGHFISRQYLATRFDENNCRPQCIGCNLFGGGKPLDFEENLKRELGSDFVEEMKKSRHQTTKLDRVWYELMIETYTDKLNSL